MPQWISGELFTGSGKKYEDLKEKQVLVFSDGIVLVVSLLMKDQVALREEQTVNISLFALHDHCSTALHLLIIPM